MTHSRKALKPDQAARILGPLILALVAGMAGCGIDLDEPLDFTCQSQFVEEGVNDELGIRSSTLGGALAQSFELDEDRTISNVRVKLQKTGDPAGTLTVSIHESSGGAPLDDPISGASAALAISEIDEDEADWYLFSFPEISLEAETTYWIKIDTNYSANDTDLVEWLANDSSDFAEGEALFHDGINTWANTGITSLDLLFGVDCAEI